MRNSTFCLLALAILLIGIGHMAFLPPFEGFDEIAHYSSIRQIADTHTIPIYGRSYLGNDIIDYQLHGPMHYAITPPYNENGGMIYPYFFKEPGLTQTYEKMYREPTQRKQFTPSTEENWQAQHPPLYYLIMAPLMKASDFLPFVTQLFVLRFVSFLMAFAGLMIGLWGSLKYTAPSMRSSIATGYLLYPLIVPMFYSEFGRLGNDGLCLFLMGVIWVLLLHHFNNEREWKPALALGVVFGIGLLTKAFFMVILAGFAPYLLLRLWRGRRDKKISRIRLRNLLLIFAPIFLASGWYVYKAITYGTLTGGRDFILLTKQGGLIANLQKRFTLMQFFFGIATTFASWSWFGTQSLTKIPELIQLPMLVMLLWFIMGYLIRAQRQKLTEPIWLPAWLIVPFLFGLLYHLITIIALVGTGNHTPGWYLSILSPALGVAFAYALEVFDENRRAQYLLYGLWLYGIAFIVVANWFQVAMYAGCAIKGADKNYQFQDHHYCLSQIPTIASHISVLGWPMLGAVGFGGGVLCLVVGLVKTIRARPRVNIWA